ncbi:MAG: DUF4214 domain-containing protein [Phycisphaerae bacterium]|nr:DUF4214 domain-containing protein [Phycisphaerae bacterium]
MGSRLMHCVLALAILSVASVCLAQPEKESSPIVKWPVASPATATTPATTPLPAAAVRPRATVIVVGSAAKVKGDVVALPITVYNVDRLGDLNVTLRYPTGQLQLVGFTKGAIPPGTMFDANTSKPGETHIGFVHAQGVTGSFALGRLDLKLLGQPGSKATVSATVTTATQVGTEAAIRFGVRNGVVTVLAKQILGDWNGDGKVTSLDALAALKMSVGKLKEDLILDVDNDGKVTAKDARLLLGSAVGIGTTPGGTTSTGTPGGTANTGTPGGTTSTGTPGGTASTGTPGGTANTGTPGGATTGTAGAGVGLGAGNGTTADSTWAFAEVYAGSDNNLDITERPAWSGDSRHVIFPGANPWRYDLADGKPTRFITSPPDPVLGVTFHAPSAGRLYIVGRQVVFYAAAPTQEGKGSCYVYMTVPITGGKPTPFLVTPFDSLLSLMALRKTPAEALIIDIQGNEWDIAPGLPPDLKASKPYFKLPLNPQDRLGMPIALSNDWKRLVAVPNSNGPPPYDTVLWELPSKKRLLAFPKARGLRSFGFSPDGTHLAAIQHPQRKTPKVVIIPLASPDKTVVAVAGQGAASYSPPAWSPDGKYLAFVSESNGPIQFGRQKTIRKMHVVRILSPQIAAPWNALQAKIAKAKADLDEARKQVAALGHGGDPDKVTAADKRLQSAIRIHNDLKKQAKQFLMRETTAPSGGGAAASANYVGTFGKPAASPRTFAIYLYRCVLHRDPTDQEIYHCLKVLKVGKSRDRETADLLTSQEYKARKTTDREFVRDVYQALLGRNPGLSEYAPLLAELKANPDRLTFIRKIAASPEYAKIKAGI